MLCPNCAALALRRAGVRNSLVVNQADILEIPVLHDGGEGPGTPEPLVNVPEGSDEGDVLVMPAINWGAGRTRQPQPTPCTCPDDDRGDVLIPPSMY